MTTSRERRAERLAARQKRIETAERAPTQPRAPAHVLAHAWAGLAAWARKANAKKPTERTRFVEPVFPPGVVPEKSGIAQDAALELALDWCEETYGQDLEFESFMGFPLLAELAQRPEYRRIVETIAQEATRKWIKIFSSGDDDNSKKIKEIEDAFDRFRIRDLMRRTSEIDGFFGRAHIYIDTGDTEDENELKTPIGDGYDAASKQKIRKGTLKGFRTVEPVWTYPRGGDYNTTNPLAPNWYAPQTWLVMSKTVHRTRLLTFVGRPVPDLFKPLYAFGGLSVSQMVKTYVDNWLRTRKSVSDLIRSFSVSGIKVDLTDSLTNNQGQELIDRIDAFVALRDNRNCMVLDKGGGASEPEEFFNVSTPLGGLSELQDQAQGQMASICGIPLVKLLGVTPSGLNASSDGEVRTFYDTIMAYNERFFRPHLRTILGIIQLDLYGQVDPAIDFHFEPLWSPSEVELAQIREIDARTASVYIGDAVIDPVEERTRLAKDDKSMYPGLDLSVEIEPPASELSEVPLPGDGPKDELEEDDGDPAEDAFAEDAEFNENDHPRDKDGKFGAGSASPAPKAKITYGSSPTQNMKAVAKYAESKGVKAVTYAGNEKGVGASYSPQQGMIGLNKNAKVGGTAGLNKQLFGKNGDMNYWQSPELWAQQQHASGWTSSASPTHVIDHEIGHHLYNAKESWVDEAHAKLVEKNVSKYASKNPNEFAAEYHAGVENGKEYPEEIHQLFKDYVKPRTRASA